MQSLDCFSVEEDDCVRVYSHAKERSTRNWREYKKEKSEKTENCEKKFEMIESEASRINRKELMKSMSHGLIYIRWEARGP